MHHHIMVVLTYIYIYTILGVENGQNSLGRCYGRIMYIIFIYIYIYVYRYIFLVYIFYVFYIYTY